MTNIVWNKIADNRYESACWRWTILHDDTTDRYTLHDAVEDAYVDKDFTTLASAQSHASMVDAAEFEGLY